MASGSSCERSQMEFLALKEQNLHLENRSQKQENELILLRDRLAMLQKDLNKSTQSLNRSKKAREFELLLNENELMQRKLQNQEEEFQLQNETLMAELAKLVKANEDLLKENKTLKDFVQTEESNDSNFPSIQDEVRHLQAQNTALQNSLIAYQEEYSKKRFEQQMMLTHIEKSEVALLQEEEDSDSSLRQCSGMTTGASESETEGNGNVPQFIYPEKLLRNQNTNDNSNRGSGFHNAADSESQWKMMNDLQLNLETEKEEKWMLRKQLQSAETKYKEEVEDLRRELELVSEKLKKKQESLRQLQEDKDCLYHDLSQRSKALELEKEAQIEELEKRKSHLEQELALAKKLAEERAEHYRKHVSKLESKLMGLQLQLDQCGKENGQRMLEQTERYGQDLKKMEQRLEEEASLNDDLRTQFKESSDAQRNTMDQLLAIQVDRDQQILALQEMNRLAEKRKSLLDDLAIKYQQESDQHKEQIKSISSQHANCKKDLADRIDQLSEKAVELEELRMEVEKMKASIHQMEGTKSWLERSLNETEEKLKHTEENYDGLLQSREAEYEVATQAIVLDHSRSIESLQAVVHSLKKEKEECLETIGRLRLEVKDGIEEKKLREKKGAAGLKELKRQLASERKRADKLQETVSNPKFRRQSMEELFRPINFYDRQTSGDSSSVSSLSPSGMSRDNSLHQSPDEDCGLVSNLQLENDDLLKRLAEVQQMKWILEEKVNHLEASNAAMAEDLIHKTALIDHFSVNSKTGHPVTSQEKLTPLKWVMELVKDKGIADESLRDANRRLQNVMEEALTKNMHLQQNLELVTRELDELQKLHSLSSATPPPPQFTPCD